jgi:hypothetical protein
MAMTELIKAFNRFETMLNQTAPKIVSRLQPGLTRVEIEKQTASFSWMLPQDAYDLYQWHNGLSGKPGKLNLAEKLLRLKGKWHGELSGRENEVHLQLGDSLSKTLPKRRIIVKFLPLDYALAGHRHLKLGRCLIDLLPISILSDGNSTIYCMMRLDAEQPIVYGANGTRLPPMGVSESFLSTQPQFNCLNDLIAFLIVCCQQVVQPIPVSQEGSMDAIDCDLNSTQFAQLYQQCKS